MRRAKCYPFRPAIWQEHHFRRLVGEQQSEFLPAIQTGRSLPGSLFVTPLGMLRIEKLAGKTSTVLRLSGRIQEEYLSQLQTEVEHCKNTPKLDLKDVNLLDQASVRFLMGCESQGVKLVNCPLYIQEWISRERRRAGPQADNE
jgi:ABC-type transporter Mla MlaB component